MFPTPILTRSALSAAVALLLTGALAAQQQFVLSSQDRARLVAIDFVAFGADGRPLTDLRAEDVTLRVDGRTRAIRSLEYVPVSAGPAPRVPAPFGTNAVTGEARTILLVIDDETLRPGREAELKDDVRALLARLGPADRVALVTVPYGGMKSDFTSDHARLLRALDPIVGRAPQSGQGANAGCTTRSTLVALAGMLDSITSADAPLTAVLFTAALVPPKGVTSLSRDGDMMVAMGTCEVLPQHYTQVGAAVAKARAQLYIVIPELSADNSGREGLEHLTGQTGAPLWNLRSGTDTALGRIAEQSSGFYLARIEPDPNEAPDTVRGFSVSANRPGVTIRHRPQMQMRRSAAADAAAATVRTPLDMMREARVFTELPLRVTGATSRNADGSLKVVAMFDTPGTETLASAMVGLFDATGRMVASSTATSAELAASPKVVALSAPTGDYRLRVAALDPQGRAGSADTELSAALTHAGPLRLSSLLVGQNRPEGFVPRMEFTSETTGLAMLEIYGQAGTPVGVAFEIATTLNGPAMATMPGAFVATNEPDRFLVTAVIPIGALEPGDYAIRAIVAAQGEAGGRVVRTIRKLPPAR